MKFHYVYRISNIILNLHYYGSRTCSKLPEEDIGHIYFSSSSDKEFIKDQKENPENYKYKIIKIFNTREEALELEVKLHNKFDVGVNESFYNKSKQSSVGFDTTGKTQIRDKDGIININSNSYDHNKHNHINKDYIVTREKGRITRKEYEDENLTHINKGMIDVLVDNKIIKITKEEYAKGGYITPRHNKIIVYNKELEKNETISKDDYNENIHQSVNSGMIKAYNIKEKVCVTVSADEFEINKDLVGINSHIVKIYDPNDKLVLSEIGKIREILRKHNFPLSMLKSNSKEKKFIPNTYNKSKGLIEFISKFDGYYYISERVYKV